MHRLIVLFPEGGPGAGLILLRLAVMACLLLQDPPVAGAYADAMDLATAVLAALLLIGLLTRTTAATCCVLALRVMHGADAGSVLPALALALSALALALLGPGAYSIDARLFGRRVLGRPR
ncbi:hypothetical protein [Pseudoxanthomonas dokdonensis]|uniref:Uncharacterized protein n=1 Tax=Pseudoxanthomonas dokdonensis TaxID=344882 RepID=A0A0R0D1S9_9GAMM|nr:hypothetical protein [Pseudoxanthomonas dokdonensis]KRG71539.1 hypothetical protein ABB29_01840 [Pseudoxanthomonas dokdonensis]